MPALRNFAISLTRDHDRADDLVQETALRAFANRALWQSGSNLQAWLFTILRNFWFTEIRKRKREVEDVDDAYAKAVAVHDSPLHHLEIKELIEAVDALPDHFRNPLRLLADGATIEEAAFELVEHDGTIKSRVNRGRTLLRQTTGRDA